MADKDGNNGVRRSDIKGRPSILLPLFVNLPDKRQGGTDNTKVCGFHH